MSEQPLIDYESIAAYVMAHETDFSAFEGLCFFFRRWNAGATYTPDEVQAVWGYSLRQWGINTPYQTLRLLNAGRMLSDALGETITKRPGPDWDKYGNLGVI